MKKKWIFFVLSALIFLCGVEIFLGAITHKKPLLERRVRLRETPPNMDVEMFFKKEKIRMRADENGFIEPSVRYPDPDLTVVFLGGSTTECRFVNEKNRFPYVTGKILEERTGLKVNSINGGVAGSHSMHSNDILLNKIIPFHPDIVVLHHCINDAVTLLLEGSYWNDNPARSLVLNAESFGPRQAIRHIRLSLFRNIFDGLSLYFPEFLPNRFYPHWGGDEFRRWRGRRIVIDKKKIADEFRLSLKIFVSICRAKGIVPVLMTEANRLGGKKDEGVAKSVEVLQRDYNISAVDFSDLYDFCQQIIREVGREEGVVVIDLEKVVPKKEDFLYDMMHYTDKGSRWVAQKIADELLPILIVKRPVSKAEPELSS